MSLPRPSNHTNEYKQSIMSTYVSKNYMIKDSRSMGTNWRVIYYLESSKLN